MEMSAVVISPVPKDLEIAHSLPLRPPTKTFVGDGDDGDDDDDDSDENEFTLSDEESNNHEIQEHEKSLNQKKTSVTSSDSRYDIAGILLTLLYTVSSFCSSDLVIFENSIKSRVYITCNTSKYSTCIT